MSVEGPTGGPAAPRGVLGAGSRPRPIEAAMTDGRDTVLIVAGEASGDLHAAKVVGELLKLAPGVSVYGMGGDRMRGAGAELLVHYARFDVVGLVEVVRHVPSLRSAMNRLVRCARARGTRVAVLVDYPGFNLMLAGRLKRMGVRVLYYISPQVWAWGEARVRKIARRVDRMAVVLPFEEQFYRDRGVRVEFVGHPLLDEPELAVGPAPAAGRSEAPPVLGLLPGSRANEIRRHLPPMVRAATILRRNVPGLTVRLARAEGVTEDLLASSGDPVGAGVEVLPPGAAREVMRSSTALLVSSGTATLEAATMGTPMVIVYRLAWPSYLVGRVLVRIPDIGLVNVVAGERIVPELVQGAATAEAMAAEVERFLTDPELRRRTSERLLDVRRSLGSPGAASRVARMALEMAGCEP